MTEWTRATSFELLVRGRMCTTLDTLVGFVGKEKSKDKGDLLRTAKADRHQTGQLRGLRNFVDEDAKEYRPTFRAFLRRLGKAGPEWQGVLRTRKRANSNT